MRWIEVLGVPAFQFPHKLTKNRLKILGQFRIQLKSLTL